MRRKTAADFIVGVVVFAILSCASTGPIPCSLSCQQGAENCKRPTCTCPEGFSKHPVLPRLCNPICSKPCINGTCIQPELCACRREFMLSQNNKYECISKCTTPCKNGKCFSKDVCTCNKGYKLDESDKFQCNPKCSKGCVNGYCSAPNICSCYNGYILDGGRKNVCKKECSKKCVNGICNSVGECVCKDEYTKVDEFRCSKMLEGTCSQACINGKCIAHEICLCDKGFTLDSVDRYRCWEKCSEGYLLDTKNGYKCVAEFKFEAVGERNLAKSRFDEIITNTKDDLENISQDIRQAQIDKPKYVSIPTQMVSTTINDSNNFGATIIINKDVVKQDENSDNIENPGAAPDEVTTNTNINPEPSKTELRYDEEISTLSIASEHNSTPISPKETSTINAKIIPEFKSELAETTTTESARNLITEDSLPQYVSIPTQKISTTVDDSESFEEVIIVNKSDEEISSLSIASTHKITPISPEGTSVINANVIPELKSELAEATTTESARRLIKSGFTEGTLPQYVSIPTQNISTTVDDSESFGIVIIVNKNVVKDGDTTENSVNVPVKAVKKDINQEQNSAPSSLEITTNIQNVYRQQTSTSSTINDKLIMEGTNINNHQEAILKCDDGYFLSENKECLPHCRKSCINSFCSAPNTCTCNESFRHHSEDKHKCIPKCSRECINSRCVAEDKCLCVKGFTPVITDPFRCDKAEKSLACSKGCANGICSGRDVCTCDPGYEKDPDDDASCLPSCKVACVNGRCVAPEVCHCYEKFQFNNKTKACELKVVKGKSFLKSEGVMPRRKIRTGWQDVFDCIAWNKFVLKGGIPNLKVDCLTTKRNIEVHRHQYS